MTAYIHCDFTRVLFCVIFLQGGYTALHKAAGKGHLDVLGLLINEGCDIDTQDDTVGSSGRSSCTFTSQHVDLLNLMLFP